LKSYFQGTYVGKTHIDKSTLFGGNENMSWNGIDGETLQKDSFNSAGALRTNKVMLFYDNETDNYQQDHSQLHWNEKLSTNWNTNFAPLHVKGKGFYEN
jgi:iron complex outermembrane receptor protein